MEHDDDSPRHPRWRGWKALAHDAVDATTNLVREGNESAARLARAVTDRLGPDIADSAATIDLARRLWTDAVLGSIRMVNRAVETVSDVGIDAVGASGGAPMPIPMRSDVVGTPGWLEDAALGVINAVVGDHLGAGSASLDLGFELRRGDVYLPRTPAPRTDRPAVVVFVHGLVGTEWSWCLASATALGDPAASFGTLLQADLGLEPVFARYNTGRPVADNGAALAARLEALSEAWDPARIVLVGHSMGGLVARAAAEVGTTEGHGWRTRFTDLVTLATPHEGAPLAAFAESVAKGLGAIELPATQVLARILDARAPSVRELREATTAPLPDVRCTFLSATVDPDPDGAIGQVLGDLLVLAPSAAGGALEEQRIPVTTQTFGSIPHYLIQSHPDVYAVVREALRG